MSPQERRTTFSLASIYAFRMLGLFMVLPVFTLYAHNYIGATPFLIGLALGIYGLTQALLQIPFGMSSDIFGRKPIIIIGLVLFALGSVLAAYTDSMLGLIAGRALQGAGAIGSTLTALVADNVRDENRLRSMSIIGMTIGLSFTGAMIVGPIVSNWVGLAGIFWLTALLAIIGIAVVLLIVPTTKQIKRHRDSEPVWGQFKAILTMPELLKLDAGIFCLHAMLTGLFIVLPVVLTQTSGLEESRQWLIYLPTLILAFIAMVPFIILAESKRKMKAVFVGAIAVVLISQLSLWAFEANLLGIAFVLFLFFTSFTILEATLPSLIAKVAPAGSKGTAMGVYSSSQFLGIFFGGVLGGVIYHHLGLHQVFLFCAVLALAWLAIAISMRNPKHLSSKVFALEQKLDGKQATKLEQQLKQSAGVSDALIDLDEQVAYLKVDKQKFNEQQTLKLLKK